VEGRVSEGRLKLSDAGAVAVLALALAAGHAWYGPKLEVDSDRHYHFALSAQAPWSGHLGKLPQVEDLGWGKRFVDKEYLFHVFTTWGYRARGERGVIAACALLALFACAGLYALCRTGTSRGAALGFTLAGALFNASFLYRLDMVRPHVLAIGLFLWTCVGLVSRRPWLAGLAACAFGLAYHALYLPLFVAALFAVLERKDPRAWKSAAAAGLGLVAGALLNPYFPHNLTMAATHFWVALNAPGAADVGVELSPLSSAELLRRDAAPLALCGLALARPWLAPFASDDERRRVAFLGAGASAFWLLTCITPRGAEYAVPLSTALAAHALADLRWLWQVAVAAAAAAAQLPGYRDARATTSSDAYAEATLPAVEALPPDAAGKKVLNCAFDEGAVLLHRRPDVRFVDVLDPMLLRVAAPELSKLRDDFEHGNVVDPRAVVRSTFHADYVLCGYPEVTSALDQDVRFVRLYPPPGTLPHGPHHNLYAVLDTPSQRVRRFDVERPGAEPGAMRELQLLPDSTLVDLRRMAPSTALGVNGGGQRCVDLRVAPEEADRLSGAQLALIGGGPKLSLTLDGQRLFEAQAPLPKARWNAVLVPLPGPLGPSQQLVLRACAADEASFHAAAVSLWTWDEVRSRCERVGLPLPEGDIPSGVERSTCLAPLAVPPAATAARASAAAPSAR
jgi:hypothetical protein